MFMPGIFAGAGLNSTDPETERDPPQVPTPVTFPVPSSVYSSTEWNQASPPPKLQSFFSKVVRPSDISASHVEALNINVLSPCAPEELIPLAQEGNSYFPPLSPAQSINAASYADVTKAKPSSAKKQTDLAERLAELRLQNDAGFCAITRTTKNGVKPPRLAWMRKFWEGLESVASYWDTSLDHYYETVHESDSADAESEKGAKRLRMDSVQTNATDGSESAVSHDTSSSTIVDGSHGSPANSDSDNKRNSLSPASTSGIMSMSTAPEPRKSWRYKGRRTGSGRDMPDQFRSDTIRAFVDAAVHPFNCTVAAPRHMPIVQMNRLNIPVRQTAAVYRYPKERNRVRSGRLEGPVMAIQVRPDTDFEAPSMSIEQIKMRARLDLMRELGGLLQLAQERRRQGRSEARPGEGKWWTTQPRWGGGAGGESVENADVQDVPPITDGMLGAARMKPPRKRKTPAMLWKELRDPRMDYQTIGKGVDSDWDEVFMVSSLNHHVSILKLTVHDAYVEYLQSETVPDPLPADTQWCSPKLQRTQWFDLLDVEQRVEAFRALWGITGYLTREIDSSATAGAEESAEESAGMSDD